MIQEENPTLAYADAGAVSATFSENPRPHYAYDGKMGQKRAKSCRVNRPADAACHQNPVHSAHRTLRP